MRKYSFYILIIYAFSNTFGKHEDKKKLSGKELIKHTRAFYEEEAKKDIENLLSGLPNSSLSEEHEDNAPRSNKLMTSIDYILKKSKSKKKRLRKLRTNAQIYDNNINNGVHVQNSLYNSDANSNQLMNKGDLPKVPTIKSRISGGHNVNTMLRNSMNYLDMKPEVYPLFIIDEKYESREKPSENDSIQVNEQYYTNDIDEFTKLIDKVGIKKTNDTLIRSSTKPMSENFGLEGLLSKLQIKRGGDRPTTKESNTNYVLNDLLNNFYTHSTNNLRPVNRVEHFSNDFDGLNDNIDSKHRDNSKTILLNRHIVEKGNSNTKTRLNEFMRYLDSGKHLRTSHNTLSYGQTAKQGDSRSRHRRSTRTQAGYTQDSDTCKTYNENLVKFWSSLSKLIKIKDQPNDRALHNIAMIIQAYLEHSNAEQPAEIHKIKHAGPRDKISEVRVRIRKLIEEGDGSAEKITKVIIKHLKPDYTDETEDCKQVNEEYLETSVNLLYGSYLENTECQGEGDMTRNKKMSMRQRKAKKGTNIGHIIVSMANSDFKPEFQSILNEDESYTDFHKSKTQRKRRPKKTRRVFKHRPAAHTSDNRNESENLNRRKSSSKSGSKKRKKSSLKSDVQKSKCEKYVIRKFLVTLRPVTERFLGLLECQLDNTLRSRFSRYSKDARQKTKSHKKSDTKHYDSTFKNSQYVRERDEDDSEAAWSQKYSFDKSKSAKSAKYAETRNVHVRVSDTDYNKQHSKNNYEYIQSPPQYDDYDGVYRANHNTLSILYNPLISLNDKKNTPNNSRSKKLASSDKGKKRNYDDDNDNYYYDSISDETNYEFEYTTGHYEPTAENSTKQPPFIDLTKLRTENQLIEEANKKTHKTFESITEFLKQARDESLKTPEFAEPFALDTNKGYVELTHLIKYPKILVYRPQHLVKNTMPYDDFLKTLNNNNMTSDDIKLMKIVRHLSNGSVQVLFETEDSEAPLEVRNLNDKGNSRRRGSPDSLVNYQSENRIDTVKENYNAILTDRKSEGFNSNYRNEALRKDVNASVESDGFDSDEYLYLDLDLDSLGHSNTLRAKENLSQSTYFDDNSDTNTTSNSEPNSAETGLSWQNPLPSLFANNSSPDFGTDPASAIGSSVDSHIEAGMNVESNPQTGSGMQMSLGTDSNLGLKLNPMHPSQLGSLFSKLVSSDSNTQATSNPDLNSQSHKNSQFDDSSSNSLSASNAYSHLNSHSGSWSNPTPSLLPYPDTSNQEVDKNFSSSTSSIILGWWRKWKNIVKGKMKHIIGKMASLTNSFDRVVTL